MNRFQSIAKKAKTLLKSGIVKHDDEDWQPAIKIGEYYLNNPDAEVEELAKERLKQCHGCLEDEPINMWKVEDVRIPELSNKSCNKCGCIAPYKFRQSIEKCPLWLH